MKISIDLTREIFDDVKSVSFYDSKTIFFDPTTLLPSTVIFKVWGAGLMPDFDWAKYIDLDKEIYIKSILQKSFGNEITIQGFGTLTFNNVVAGKICISPYDSKEFLKDKTGKQIQYRREWTLENIDNDSYEYWLDTSIYFPYGACDLKLYAKGNVTFEFDTDDCVSGIEYITNPNRQDTFWGYLKDKTLTTNSYKYEDLSENKSQEFVDNGYSLQNKSIKTKRNNAHLPDNLNSGMENLSGYSMDDVKVHYNSKPAQLHAHAQGTDIHLGPGEEKHLPHEAWHVVEQKQGRVKPTMQMYGKVNVNDDGGLEKEADMMGGKVFPAGVSVPLVPINILKNNETDNFYTTIRRWIYNLYCSDNGKKE